MLKKEIKVNLKSFIIWTSIIIGIFLFVYLIYPLIINDETMESMEQVINSMSKEVVKAFNMDIASINTAYGWVKSEGLMFLMLLMGIYASNLGMNIVLKEENDKTIEYLNSLPQKRSTIMKEKIITCIIYILSMILIVGIFNYIGLSISCEFDKKQYLLLAITPIFVTIPLFSLNLFISTFLHKTNKTMSISLGIVFISYFLQIASELSSKVEFLKYFSLYTLADTRNIITEIKLNPLMIIISLAISIILISLSFIRYENKELI